MVEVREALLEKASTLYQGLIAGDDATPEARLEKGLAYIRLARILSYQATNMAPVERETQHGQARQAIAQSIALRGPSRPSSPTSRVIGGS